MTPADLTLLCAIRSGTNTFRELDALIADSNYSRYRIEAHLTRLEALGLITRTTGKAATIRLTEAGHQATSGYLLSRDGEQITGVWRVDWVATAHYASPLTERETVFCTAEEYEELAS